MNLFICKYCHNERKNKKSLIAHEVFCNKNPNHKIGKTDEARKKSLERRKCNYCENLYTLSNINKHENSCIKNPLVITKNTVICPICKMAFIGNSTTCSYSCSNTYFRHSNEGGLRYVSDDILIKNARYRDLCFRYHDKKCVVCEEKNIVAVHHINENHEDNRPENLIPLCPTHHQYVHSKYKNLIEKQINDYVIQWLSEYRP